MKWMRRLLVASKKQEGFTLIELMVVVIILGILAAIALPQLTGQTNTAKNKRARSDIKTLGSSVELYIIEQQDEPLYISSLVDANYLRKENADPWGGNYYYSSEDYAAGNVPFTLYVYLRDEDGDLSSKLYYPDM